MRRILPITCALLLPLAAFAGWPRGAELNPALLVDVTEPGLEKIAEAIPGFIPNPIEIPDINQSGGVQPVGAYDLSVSNLWLTADIQEADIEPGNGVLTVSADGEITIASPQDPFNVTFDVTLFGGNIEVANCDAWVTAFNVEIDADATLDVEDGALDATIGEVGVEWDVTNDNVELECWIGDMDDVLDYVNLSPINLALDFIKDYLVTVIDDQKPQIEQLLEDSFAAANIEQQIDLAGNTLNVALHPEDVQITPDGVRVIAAGGMSAANSNPCVAEYGHTESLQTDSPSPGIGEAPNNVYPHMAVYVPDDLLNQGLFAVYDAGLLCYTLQGDVPIPITTDLLTILNGDAFAPLFPSSQPMVIKTRPVNVPTATPEGDGDINVQVEDLGLDFIAELDGRQATILATDLDVDAGADVLFDNQTGLLSIGVELGAENISPAIRLNEFAPGQDEAILSSFGSLVNTLVGPLLGGALDNLSFPLPSFNGFGLTSAEIEPAGDNEDFFGVFARVGDVPYENAAGCDGGEGCSTGCGTGGIGGLWLGLPLGFALRRRRSPQASK